MDVKKFFQSYPGAKPLWKVGNKYFLNSRRDLADIHARRTNELIEEVSGPAPAPAKKEQKSVSDGTE